MKLVAASDFRNTSPDRIEIDNHLHVQHVHKGARFTIGGDAPFDKLPAQDKKLVVELNSAGRIVEESQKEAVAKIDEEVKLADTIAKKKAAAAAGDKK